jgi:hypothetical protein
MLLMRKYIHPLLKETLIQLTDGSVFSKNWLYFRSFLRLDLDFTTNKIWKKIKKENLVESVNYSTISSISQVQKIKKIK